MLTEQNIKTAMQSYLDCFNQDDLEGILALYAEHAVLEDPAGTAPIRGKAAIREFYGRVVNGKTRISREEPIRGSHGNSGAMAIHIETQTPDSILVFHVIEVMEFDESGLITSMKAYWGRSDMDKK
ncbi:nuclear transport factor 2 family protein [Paenibacillus chibensis]|uniref:Nuclear transport factor 2 family protein n=1 Tax=Paenibacillus chibensis TaxID=59846 RepID=A0ABU6Q247_9BACL|nr:nuclear transport factor 2 family protein [Paenibacillus chibensis]MEC0370461.1 nuclear transport factor 2 family protein [Paenibacillus chibensis]MED5020689.1 nuclear transport factor 2 family protein [Paenibacillus chibensis]